MKALYWQRGETLDYMNGTDAKIEANTVMVIGDKIGVAGTDIPAGQMGSVHVSGVFEMDKADSTDIPIGKTVYFSEAGITATAVEGSTTLAGFAAASAAADATKIFVKLNG